MIHYVLQIIAKSLPNFPYLWVCGNSSPNWIQIQKEILQVALTVMKVFETGCSHRHMCTRAFHSGSIRTESINDMFKKKSERSRVIKVWSIARIVFNSSIIKASLKCHPLFTSSIKCLTSMVWFFFSFFFFKLKRC